MSVSIKTAKKIGFFTAVSVLIGSIIGIGIFFKNNTVFQDNNNNPYGVLISWILASIISLTTAFSFAEVGFNHRDGAGLGGAAERMYGPKFGRFISFNYSFFYFSILNLSIAIFSAEAIVKIFYATTSIPREFHMGYIMLIGIALMFLFVVFNYISSKASGYFQNISTILKFVPLIAVGLSGIIVGARDMNNGLFDPNNTTVGSINIQGVLSSIPAILFAYDSFLGVASLQGEMENPKKKVPLVIIIGMSICILFYLFVTIGQIMVAQGTAQNVFNAIFGNDPKLKNIFSILLAVFILVCVLGVLNSLTLVGLRTFSFAVQYRVIWGYWLFDKHLTKKNKSGMILSFILYGFWWIILLIPSAIMNSDVIIDGVSNFPTLFMFAIYGTIVLKAWINRFTKKIHVNKMPGFIFVAPIAILGCYLAFGYQFFYQYTFRVFLGQTDGIYSWGLFVGQGGIEPFKASIVFFTMLAVFVIAPFFNDSLIRFKYRKIESHEILKSELLI